MFSFGKQRILFLIWYIILSNFSGFNFAIETNDLEVKKINCTWNEIYLENVSCTMSLRRNNYPLLGAVGTIVSIINQGQITLKVFKKFNHFEEFPLKMKANLCDILRGRSLNILTKLIRGYIMDRSNFNSSCPVYPGPFIVQNVTLDRHFSMSLPSLFPKGLYRAELAFFKKNDNGKLVLIFTYQIFLINKDNF